MFFNHYNYKNILSLRAIQTPAVGQILLVGNSLLIPGVQDSVFLSLPVSPSSFSPLSADPFRTNPTGSFPLGGGLFTHSVFQNLPF